MSEQQPGAEAKGIVCPRCGCPDLDTYCTRRLPGNRVRRYKTCRNPNCGRTVVTVEVSPSQVRR